MAENFDQGVLNQLQRFADATCLIETDRYQGTGFHFGNGWIMSVAHNFQNDESDREFQHSRLTEARFTFTSTTGEQTIFVPPPATQRRMGFIHHLQPGEDVDSSNKDIAMIKLGIQYARSGKEQLTDWESRENNDLTALQLTNFATMDQRVVGQNESVYAIHYGGDDNRRQMVKLTVRNVTAPNAIPFGTITLHPAPPRGASGCPIINQNFHLVGMLIGGDYPDYPDPVGYALKWEDIKKYTNTGVQIIPELERYWMWQSMGQYGKAKANREELVRLARDHKLTIYLMDGEDITGQ